MSCQRSKQFPKVIFHDSFTLTTILDRHFIIIITMSSTTNYILASIPLLIPALTAISLLENPQALASRWVEKLPLVGSDGDIPTPSVSSQLLVYSAMGFFGFVLTNRLVPSIKEYTLRKGICGKDLGKRGTALADLPV